MQPAVRMLGASGAMNSLHRVGKAVDQRVRVILDMQGRLIVNQGQKKASQGGGQFKDRTGTARDSYGHTLLDRPYKGHKPPVLIVGCAVSYAVHLENKGHWVLSHLLGPNTKVVNVMGDLGVQQLRGAIHKVTL